MSQPVAEEPLSRELTVVISLAGFTFPDVERIEQWLEQTALVDEAVATYLPKGVAILFRGITSNLPEDADWMTLAE